MVLVPIKSYSKFNGSRIQGAQRYWMLASRDSKVQRFKGLKFNNLKLKFSINLLDEF